MFCKKCGSNISENNKFCPRCGALIVSDTVSEPTIPVESGFIASSHTSVEATSKKRGKKIAIISIISTVVLVSIVAVILLIINFGGSSSTTNNSSSNDDKNEKSEGSYESEVQAYLDYVAEHNTSAHDYIADTYFGGDFGLYYSGKDATDAHETMMKALFEERKEDAEMGYDYGSFDFEDLDSWEDYLKESTIDYGYDEIYDVYGRWEMTYEITSSGKLRDSEISDLQDIWEDVPANYEYIVEDLELKRSDKNNLEDFIHSIEDLEVSDGYYVEVDVNVSGSRDSLSEHYEFLVGKVGDEWVILEGPDLDEIFEQ